MKKFLLIKLKSKSMCLDILYVTTEDTYSRANPIKKTLIRKGGNL